MDDCSVTEKVKIKRMELSSKKKNHFKIKCQYLLMSNMRHWVFIGMNKNNMLMSCDIHKEYSINMKMRKVEE